MFNALVVTRARNCPWQLWQSSQNIWIHQNLSILSREPLMLITSTESLSWSNFFSSWTKKCWDCFYELQKISTLSLGLHWRKSATSDTPFKINCAFLKHISNFMSISFWQNSTTIPRRMQLELHTSTVSSDDRSQMYDVGNVVVSAISPGRWSCGWLPYIRRKSLTQRAHISSRKDNLCCTWMCTSSMVISMISSSLVAPCWVFEARLLNWINQLHCQREKCCHCYCQPQRVDSSNKHKKTNHYEQYKLIAHPVSEILFLALESMLEDCTAI